MCVFCKPCMWVCVYVLECGCMTCHHHWPGWNPALNLKILHTIQLSPRYSQPASQQLSSFIDIREKKSAKFLLFIASFTFLACAFIYLNQFHITLKIVLQATLIVLLCCTYWAFDRTTQIASSVRPPLNLHSSRAWVGLLRIVTVSKAWFCGVCCTKAEVQVICDLPENVNFTL